MAKKKTELVFSSISALEDGTRDVAIDCTDMLETSESVQEVDVTSSDDTVLTATNEAKNAVAITKEDGSTIAINKGVQFQLATQDATVVSRDILLNVTVTGDSGSKEVYEVSVPVVDKKRK